MWLSRQRGPGTRHKQAAQVGSVTLAGDPAAAVLDGERRDLPVFGPGGYVWRPQVGDQVLVVKSGADGEQPCIAGVRTGADWGLEPGEVGLFSSGASIILHNGGVISMSGAVFINGKAVLVEE